MQSTTELLRPPQGTAATRYTRTISRIGTGTTIVRPAKSADGGCDGFGVFATGKARPPPSPDSRTTQVPAELEWLGGPVGRLLPTADQPDQDRSGDAVEAVPPVDESGAGLPNRKERAGHPADPASERESCPGALLVLRTAAFVALSLGYVLWKALAQRRCRAGPGDTQRTLIEEFAKIKSGDVVLPARMADGRRRTIHLCCVTTPDEAQKVLLNRLGMTLPQRLRRIDKVAPM